MSRLFSIDDVARVVHEANRALQVIGADPAPSPPWDEAGDCQRQACREGVLDALAGSTPEELHADWVAHRHRDGWTFGAVKDERAKTHPCLVPYDELPDHQRAKDDLLHAIVAALGRYVRD